MTKGGVHESKSEEEKDRIALAPAAMADQSSHQGEGFSQALFAQKRGLEENFNR